uniref:Eukaryotic translation initiation factor 5B n=1 Tax=Scophthalmus maximus TaxID=52904 RepID=A0A8D3BMM5_SCOMX
MFSFYFCNFCLNLNVSSCSSRPRLPPTRTTTAALASRLKSKGGKRGGKKPSVSDDEEDEGLKGGGGGKEDESEDDEAFAPRRDQKKKNKSKAAKAESEDEDEEEEGGNEGFKMKTAAQKKAEKKERDKKKKEEERMKQKKLKEKEVGVDAKKEPEKKTTEATRQVFTGKRRRRRRKTRRRRRERRRRRRRRRDPDSECLLEEEERMRRLEELETQRLEQERLEQERKEKKKQKEKERKERLKKEGKLLTKAQRDARARAEATLKLLQAQGVEVPSKDSMPKKKPVYGDKRKKKPNAPTPESINQGNTDTNTLLQLIFLTVSCPKFEESEGEEEKDTPPVLTSQAKRKESEDESSESDDDDGRTKEERLYDRAKRRIEKRKTENLRNTDLERLRSPVVCVLGHVDTGKTKILDKLRHTHVQDGEAGGITQQIGATNVPKETIEEQTRMVKNFNKEGIKIPGMLIIDTPGHESFSNLRNRGSSLCDIAILVVDIMHGLEPQTLRVHQPAEGEEVSVYRRPQQGRFTAKRVPPLPVVYFLVFDCCCCLQIDRLYDWKRSPETDVHTTLKKQKKNTKDEFDGRAKAVIVEFAQQGLNAALFYENKDPRTFVSMVPTSAHSGDGMGNLIALLIELTQTMLARRLAHCDELRAQVMEVKALPGMGTTIDVILINGCLREGETIIVPGVEGPIVTQIRGLLLPPPLKELRVKNQYEKHKEVSTAQGVKILGKDLEKTLAGLPLLVAHHDDEIPVLRDELERELKQTLSSIKLEEKGVYVQASTLGSLEALLEFLRTSKVPYSGINIGPVHKRDVMKASAMLEHDQQYAVILAFDVKVERESQEMADSLGVRVFWAEIIYHLFDAFTKYREDYKKAKQDEFKHIAVFPVKLKVLPQFIFNSRDPIVMGVTVEAGVLRQGTPLCVPAKGFVDIGVVTSIEMNHKSVESAKKGQEICIKIEPIPGESPKMFGRHFEATDPIVSKITRASIDALKNWFRDEMQKTDWQLIVELKKTFEII